ncbi:MAG TPA: HIT family protein, partial [Anaerolineae bacterium]|nr:HIT family protein [Anaerolineae bacterium]
DYRWQHRFPTLAGDPGKDGKARPLPVDGYFPRHRLIVEYWEQQHSAPVPIMDEHLTVSGVSAGHQRRLYDVRRREWAEANGLRLVILDYRGFPTDGRGRIVRDRARDLELVASALRAARVAVEPARVPFDPQAYMAEIRCGCFICRLVRGDPSLPAHHVIWRGPAAIAFLNRFPTVYGYTLVAPVAHVEEVTGDLSLNDYLALQRVVHAVGEAVRLALKPERIYLLSFGNQAGTPHVHWHVVPCPPGLPFEEQQLALLDVEKRGTLPLGGEEGVELAQRIRAHLPAWMRESAVARDRAI